MIFNYLHYDAGNDIFERFLKLRQACQTWFHHSVCPLIHFCMLKDKMTEKIDQKNLKIKGVPIKLPWFIWLYVSTEGCRSKSVYFARIASNLVQYVILALEKKMAAEEKGLFNFHLPCSYFLQLLFQLLLLSHWTPIFVECTIHHSELNSEQ